MEEMSTVVVRSDYYEGGLVFFTAFIAESDEQRDRLIEAINSFIERFDGEDEEEAFTDGPLSEAMRVDMYEGSKVFESMNTLRSVVDIINPLGQEIMATCHDTEWAIDTISNAENMWDLDRFFFGDCNPPKETP